MLQNAYFLAKIGADTAENEQHSAEILPTDALWRHRKASSNGDGHIDFAAYDTTGDGKADRIEMDHTHDGKVTGVRGLGLAKFCKFLAGSFSAVSKRNFARKYAFDSIFQVLQDLHTFAPLQSQNFRKKSVWKISNFREISAKNCKCRKICKILSNFKNFSLRIW